MRMGGEGGREERAQLRMRGGAAGAVGWEWNGEMRNDCQAGRLLPVSASRWPMHSLIAPANDNADK
jgi:hypothetical protein